MPRVPPAFASARPALAVLIAIRCAATAATLRIAAPFDDGTAAAAAFRSSASASGDAGAAEEDAFLTSALAATGAAAASESRASPAEEAGEAAAKRPLGASRRVPLGKFVRALLARLAYSHTAQIRAIGPNAYYMALKATVLANKEVVGLPGQALGVVPVIRQHGNQTEALLEVRALPEVGEVRDIDVDVAHGLHEDVEFLANVIAQRLQVRDVVTIDAVGARGAWNLLLAAVRAMEIMGNVRLALVPRIVEIHIRDRTAFAPSEFSAMRHACVRA